MAKTTRLVVSDLKYVLVRFGLQTEISVAVYFH